MIDELEKKYRQELQFQIKHWRSRAETAEKFLGLVLKEYPSTQAFVMDKAKCDNENGEVKCRNCTCWKRDIRNATNEP